MKTAFSLFLTACSFPVPVLSVQCGKFYSTTCLAEEDKRYDEAYTNDLNKQEPLWTNLSGLWKADTTSFEADGSPTQPSHFNPVNASTSFGFPYTRDQIQSYFNLTTTGSRQYQHIYNVLKPAPLAFCDLPRGPGDMNVLAGGTCGVNGFATWSENTRVASYEKDGTVKNVFATIGFVLDPKPTPSAGEGSVIGDNTLFTVTEGTNTGSTVVSSKTFTFTNFEKTTASELLTIYNRSFNVSKLIGFQISEYTKLNESEFVTSLQDAWEEANVQPFARGGGGQLPMQTECLAGEGETSCVTEEQWCELDPACSESPYQEPGATMLAGPIAGVVLALCAGLIAALYLLHRKILGDQKKKIRQVFAKQIAGGVTIQSGKSLTMEDISLQFKNIDKSRDGLVSVDDNRICLPLLFLLCFSSCGRHSSFPLTFFIHPSLNMQIDKEELHGFVMTGDAITMSESDFELMFVALDSDGSGNINYTEFVAFINLCVEEFNENGIAQEA